MSLRAFFKSRPPTPSPSPSPSEPGPSKGTTAKNTLKNTLIVLEKAVDGLPIPGLKAAVGSLLEIIKIVDKAKQNQDGLQDLGVLLRRLEDAIITPLLDNQRAGISPSLEARITRLTNELSKLANDWQRLKAAHKFTHRFINYEDYARAVTDINKTIKDSLDAFTLDSQISGAIVAESVQRAVARVEKHLLSKEIQALPRANAAYDSISRNSAPTCFKGTREGVLDDFQKWFITGSTFMYVLLGIAGVGKSTIAQTIAALIAGDARLAASFFFSRLENDRNNSQTFFSSLAFQLAQHNEDFATRISKALQESPDAARETVSKQLQKLIIEPLKDAPSPITPMLIVLDALDECEDENASEILRLLLAQLPRLPFIKIFLTTRPEPHLKSILDQASARDGLVLHDIEASVVSEDIGRFLKYQLSPEEVERVLPGCGWCCGSSDLDALVLIAGRLFIVASTCEKFIKDKTVRDPQHQLSALLQNLEAASNDDSAPFAGLDRLYVQVLEAAIPSDQAKAFVVERFQLVVGTVIALRDPLSSQALAGLLGKSIAYVNAVLDVLQSIIISSTHDPRPQIYHPSFRDFIINNTRCKQERFLIELPKHHTRLAVLCFDLMDRLLKRNICNFTFPGLYMENAYMPELATKIKAHLPPELVYACSFWEVHMTRCSSNRAGELMEKLKRFMFNHLLFWLEVLSLIGRIEIAYTTVLHAQKFGVDHGASPDLLSILNDALRFIMGSQQVMKMAALHVYYSALPFAPSETLLWRTYEKEAEGSVRVLGGRDRSWNPLLAVLGGHTGSITSIALSPNSAYLASGSFDFTVRLWDAITGALLVKLEGHIKTVTVVKFSPNSSRLVSGSNDNTLCLWDAAAGALLAKLEGHLHPVSSAVFSSDSARLASGSYDGSVRIWDAVTGASLAKIQAHSQPISSVVYSPNNARLASASFDNTIRVWDAATGASLARMEGHSNIVSSVAYSPSGLNLASASYDHTIRLWDAVTGALLFKADGHSLPISSVVFSPDGTRLASASYDTTVRVWNASTGASLVKVEGHTNHVSSVVFSPDSTRLASASADNTMRLWDSATGEPLATMEGHSGQVSSLAFSHDGTRLVSASRDSTVRLWDAVTRPSLAQVEGHSSPVTIVVFTPDGTRLASTSADHTIRLWSAVTGALLAKAEGHSASVTLVVFSPDSTRLASTSLDNTVRLWNTADATLLAKMEGHTGRVTLIDFSPNGIRLVSSSVDGTIRLWNAVTGAPLASLGEHPKSATLIRFSPDGSRLATASSDKIMRLWDTVTGASLAKPKVHPGFIWGIIFSPDGNQLVSGCSDINVRLWDATTGSLVAKYPGGLNLVAQPPHITTPSGGIQTLWGAKAPVGSREEKLTLPLLNGTPDPHCIPDFYWKYVHLNRSQWNQCWAIGVSTGGMTLPPIWITLCYLPIGFTTLLYPWHEKVMAAGLGDGRVILVDTSTLQLGDHLIHYPGIVSSTIAIDDTEVSDAAAT